MIKFIQRIGKDKRLLVSFSIFLLSLGFFVGGFLYKSQKSEKFSKHLSKNDFSFIRDHSPTLGPDDAKVTIVEFLDPECESCRAFYPLVKEILMEHPKDVRLVIRYVPFHGNSRFIIGLLEGARIQGKYWEALTVLFKYHPRWASHHNPRPDLVWEYLPEVNVDISKLKTDLQRPEIKEKINKIIETDLIDAKALKVNGTPTFFVNEKPLPQFGYQYLRNLVNQELNL